MRRLILILCFVFTGCSIEYTCFTEKSLTEKFVSLDDQEIAIGEILNRYQGKKVLIDIWASWCKDCIVGLPKLKALQKENPDVVYLFLSLDRNVESWKRAIKRFKIEGEHYFMKEGKKGPFGDFLNVWWIPRYVVVDEAGNITLFKATKITDKNIVQALKK